MTFQRLSYLKEKEDFGGGHFEKQKSQRADGANPRPGGTSGMSPADSASRAGAMPEASGDSSSGTFDQEMPRHEDQRLKSFWLTFPEDLNAPAGMGITAFDEKDALALLSSFGYEFHKTMKKIEFKEIDSIQDVHSWVGPNAGPLYFRGIWYPCLNLGYSPSGEEPAQASE